MVLASIEPADRRRVVLGRSERASSFSQCRAVQVSFFWVQRCTIYHFPIPPSRYPGPECQRQEQEQPGKMGDNNDDERGRRGYV